MIVNGVCQPSAATGPLRVCLDARLVDGIAGGIQQWVTSLAAGLGRLTDGDEEYLFLTYADHDAWLRPYLGSNSRILECPPTPHRSNRWKTYIASFPIARRIYGQAKVLVRPNSFAIPQSDGLIECAGTQVMHFTTQRGFYTTVPTIYQPWDLQHRHLPHFFPPDDYATREIWYRGLCDQAECVIVASSWTKHDLIEQYGIPSEKVHIVPVASMADSYNTPTAEQITTTSLKHRLPKCFIFYPAQSWAHKNHLALLEALALLRDQGITVNLVLTGAINGFYRRIQQRIRALDLTTQVWHIGYVSPLEIQCLYHLCRCLVFPSTFEGWGIPITEAFQIGCPVCCSNVTSLPAMVGNAALLFHPDRPTEIADTIRHLWTDDQLCQDLIVRAKQRVDSLSLEHSARMVRAHYRRLAGRSLDATERALLAAPPLV